MKRTFSFLSAATLAGALGLALAGCERTPSCEELGGQRVAAGMHPMYAGKVLVLVRQYRCEVAQ